MGSISTFEILAEVSIGLAGFGSIAIVLAQGRREMRPEDRFRALGLYFSSLGALFLALLPIGIAHTHADEILLWQLSSSAMAVYIVFITLAIVRMRARYLPQEHYGGPLLTAFITITTIINLAAQMINVAAWPHVPHASPYYFGVIWFLGYGCIFFMRLMFHQPRENSDEDVV